MPAWLASPLVKIGGGAILAIALFAGFQIWLAARDDAAFNRGKESVETALREAQARADSSERTQEWAFGVTTNLISQRQERQQQDLRITLAPLQKALTNAIQSDPGARCAMSGGVRDNLEAQRGAVNARIAASDPS